MKSEYFIVVLMICAGIIIAINISNRKKKLNKRIETLYEHVNSLLGKFIEKWEEEKILNDGKKMFHYIEQKKYSYDMAIDFIKYYKSLTELIYKNNLSVVEERIR